MEARHEIAKHLGVVLSHDPGEGLSHEAAGRTQSPRKRTEDGGQGRWRIDGKAKTGKEKREVTYDEFGHRGVVPAWQPHWRKLCAVKGYAETRIDVHCCENGWVVCLDTGMGMASSSGFKQLLEFWAPTTDDKR